MEKLTDLYYYLRYRFLDETIMEIKHGFQRMFRGYDDTAYWGLDGYLSNIALPVLKQYRQRMFSRPWISDKMTEEEQWAEWARVLDKMIRAFELMNDWDYMYESKETHEARQKEIDEGLQLFAKYYQGLWD